MLACWSGPAIEKSRYPEYTPLAVYWRFPEYRRRASTFRGNVQYLCEIPRRDNLYALY